MSSLTNTFSGRATRGGIALLMVGALTACGTTGGIKGYTPIGDPVKTQTRDTECGFKTTTTQNYSTPTDEEKLVRLSQSYTFDEQCGDLSLLAIVAKTELDTPEGALASSAVLLALSGKNPYIKTVLQEALQRNQITEESLHERVARDFISSQVATVRRPNDQKPNLPVVGVILGLYDEDKLPEDQRRFPAVDIGVIRQTIDGKLEETGLDIEMLQRAYNFEPLCTKKIYADGSEETSCSNTLPSLQS